MAQQEQMVTAVAAVRWRQVHVWLRPVDVQYLRLLAQERDQTLSAVVRFLINDHRTRQRNGESQRRAKDVGN
jgi:hypothetical protein